MKVNLSFLGFFMLIPGLVKFVDPFKTFFIEQIAYTELPFPFLTRVMGQSSEILTGLILFYLVFYSTKINKELFGKLFYFSHLMLVIILSVALYVHFHPAVPAEILPFEEKKPFLTVAMLIGVALNIFLIKQKNQNK